MANPKNLEKQSLGQYILEGLLYNQEINNSGVKEHHDKNFQMFVKMDNIQKKNPFLQDSMYLFVYFQ